MNNSKKKSLSLLFLIVFSLVLNYSLPTIALALNDGSWSAPYTVEQAISNQSGSAKTVVGYVVGQPTATTTVITSNYPNDYAIALADTANESNTSKILYVQIATNFRSTFGLQSNSSLLGKKVIVTGSLSAYFSHAGLKSITKIEVFTNSGTTTPPTTTTPTTPGTTTPTASTTEAYYSTAVGKSGASLKAALHEIIDDNTKLSYSAVWDALKVTDQDPNNSNNVILLYTGRSQSKSTNGSGVNDWNREHVWAKSHGNFGTAIGAGTDIHHLRPTDVSVNSSRGNLDFDIGGTPHSEATLCRYDSDSWEPRDAVKGDVARMLFYMAVRYEGDSGEPNLELNNSVNNGTAPYIGKLSVLLKWNEQDPPDAFERRRNEIIYTNYQHNRNPFIDHPEWVKLIWN